MKNKKGNFITFILIIMIIVIFSATVYFCLDVFGIIDVPTQYSIASLFYSQIEVIATGGEIITENIIPENLIETDDISTNGDSNIEVSDEEIVSSNVENPLIALEQIESEKSSSTEEVDVSENISARYFYYDQLDKYAQIMYDELFKNIDQLKTGNYTADFDTTFNDLLHEENGSEVLNNSFQLAINALTFDNPELFYIDITKMNLITEITTKAFSTTYRISIGGNGKNYLADEFLDENAVNSAIDSVEQVKNEIINLANNETDIVEKIRVIHDYLIDTVEYDATAGRNVYNIYGALIEKKAVCEGYARAYKDILDEMGIPCIIACGIAQNSSGVTETHAWNYVKINGVWYAVDVTWDDPVIIGNGKITDDIRYSYFLNGSTKFFTDHYEDGNIAGDYNFVYPTISDTDY